MIRNQINLKKFILTSFGLICIMEIMRHASSTKDTVRSLRKRGLSLNQIHSKTKIPITTIHDWVSDIQLSKEQLEIFKLRIQNALQAGRLKKQKTFRENRVKKEKELLKKGKDEVAVLNKREMFIAGVALYWGEGFKNKHEHRLGFCNSDPEMIRFYIAWLKKILGIEKKYLIGRLSLNISYKHKTKEIEEFWSNLTGIPLSQFTKTFYQNTVWKKQYATDNYYGVLRIHVKDSLDYLLKMRGWIEGLKSDLRNKVNLI